MKPASLTLDPMTVPEFRILLGKELEPCVDPEPPGSYYVYILVDPRDNSIFYVGKGSTRRWARHAEEVRHGRIINKVKYDRINDMIQRGISYEAFFVRRGLSEQSAFAHEKQIVNLIGKDRLTNAQKGIPSIERQKARAAKLMNKWVSALDDGSEQGILAWIKGLCPLGLTSVCKVLEMAEQGSPQSVTVYQDGTIEYGY